MSACLTVVTASKTGVTVPSEFQNSIRLCFCSYAGQLKSDPKFYHDTYCTAELGAVVVKHPDVCCVLTTCVKLAPSALAYMDSVLSDFAKESKILEIGCGMSRLGQAFAAAGYTDVTCIDFSTVAIAAMRNRHRHVIGLRCKTAFDGLPLWLQVSDR